MSTLKKLLAVFAFVIPSLTACGGPKEVKVTLTDFGIESSLTVFRVGARYHFVVTNVGTVSHEIMLMEPMQDKGTGMDMEELDQFALAVIEEDVLTPGVTESFDYIFMEPTPKGHLEFACHVEGHYEAGMHLPITVK